jgi:hypothetical protein
MQLKKLHWKRSRAQKPCRGCGEEHETMLCLTRAGDVRPISVAWTKLGYAARERYKTK